MASCLLSVGTAQEQDDEEVVELSPFILEATDSSGYQATSTLAGTRLKTDLKDLGSSISVVTEQFMDDLGATDAETLLSYIGNIEVGGDQGNFTGAEDQGFGRYFQVDARTNPQTNQRVRGLLAADLTRGYYLTDIPLDSYNTDRVTVSRGPNSILFGIGSPGGVINNGLKQAVLNSQFGEVRFRVDDHGSARASLDFNKSIIEDRLALRVALLEENKKYQQKPAFQDQTRIYAALTGVLLEGNGHRTTVRMNWENGVQDGSPVEVIPPTVAYDNWFEPWPASNSQFTGITAGSRYISPSEGGTWEFQDIEDTRFHERAGNRANVNNAARALAFRHVGVFFSEAGQGPNVGGGTGLGAYNNLIPWNAGRDTYASAGLVGTPVAEGIDPNTPINQYRALRTISAAGESFGLGFAANTLQNRDVFDFYNRAYSNGHDTVYRNFEAFNVALEQTFFDGKLGFEVAYDKQDYKTVQDFPFSGGQGTNLAGPYEISVDLNRYLPTGQLNPNLGRAMTWVRQPKVRRDTVDRENARATAFYELDFTEKDGLLKHFGRHVFTGMYSDYTKDTFNATVSDMTNSNEFNIDSAQQHTLGVGRRAVNLIVYSSPSLIGVNALDDVRLQPLDFQRPRDGDSFSFAWVDTTPAGILNAGVAGDRAVHVNNVFVQSVQTEGNISQTNIETSAFTWQSHLFNDHIVGLYGRREDETSNFARNAASETSESQFFSDRVYNPAFTKLSSTPTVDETGTSESWSVVARVPSRLLADFPFDVQAHWATSENFNPIGLRSNALGATIDQPSGTTDEFGFTISSKDNRYSVKFNWYETELGNISAGVGTNLANHVFGRINNHRNAEQMQIPISRQLDLIPNGGGASHPIQSYEAYYTAMLNATPAELLAVVNPVRVDDDGDGNWDRYQFDAIPNLQATRSQLAEGMEVELVANITPNWRMLVNVAQQETSFDKTAPLMGPIITSYVADARNSRLDELQDDPTFQQDAEFYSEGLGLLPIPIVQAQALDGTVANEQREWRFTGVSTYDFREGKLKGFGVGGALRWQDEASTGYVQIVDPTIGVIPDVSRPFYDDGLFSGDAWISYRRPLGNDKIDWQIQLNVRNLIGERGNIPVKTNPDGRVAVIRTPNPRTIYLSNTFKF
ncbi:MAG: hypothetical protein SynsKO_34030 [Synoicihabitans sp.]